MDRADEIADRLREINEELNALANDRQLRGPVGLSVRQNERRALLQEQARLQRELDKLFALSP